MIYLDNAATTKISDEVLAEMLPYLKEEFGNAGSIHTIGRQAEEAVCKARKQVADFINASPEQIIFTSGGSEANNLAIKGVIQHLTKIGKQHVISSNLEHDSLLNAIASLGKEFRTTFLTNDKSGMILMDEFKNYITMYGDVGLVSVMGVNNEIGTFYPLKSIGNICRKNNILFHTDCVQAASSVALDVDYIGCDMMSISSHKLHAPKGVGALFVRDKTIINPIISGGASQEFGVRGGTENVAGIVGFGKACELLKGKQNDNSVYTCIAGIHFE